jgi:predicted DNA-binding ribbon-helix-helix protein
MSDHPKKTDLEAQIDTLIKRAEDTLRQQLNDLHRCHAAEVRQDQAPQRPRRMKSPIVKHSISIAGHKTSVSLENAFWKDLREIAAERHMKVSDLARTIRIEREKGNLSSAIRLFVLEFHQKKQTGNRAA